MNEKNHVLESNVPFAESIIWKLNRSYYQETGISAWSGGIVPHDMTSNAFVGKTYAGLILGFLKDLAIQRQTQTTTANSKSNEKVYILELGSGHGRLAFHVLQQLDKMIAREQLKLPAYCFVLTDIVDSNLAFFQNHPQFSTYIHQEKLDVAYFDGVASKEVTLRNSGLVITQNSLTHPILVIANYFFDSIPNDLYKIENKTFQSCDISITSKLDQNEVSTKDLLESLSTTFDKSEDENPQQSPSVQKLLMQYSISLVDTYLLMPRLALECMNTLKGFSQKGMMLISMDKGFCELSDLEKNPPPEIIAHGSFSLYVNFHALSKYCENSGGKSLFASFSDFSLKLACLLFLPNSEKHYETIKAYDLCVNDFGPDDYIGLKSTMIKNAQNLSLRELISFLRLSFYDSNLFLQLLPSIKQHIKSLTMEERKRLKETLTRIGENFFSIKEPIDTIYEIGGLLYDLGYYRKALYFFELTSQNSGELADLYYNIILCHYQLRQDKNLVATLAKAKLAFPNYKRFAELSRLDLNAK